MRFVVGLILLVNLTGLSFSVDRPVPRLSYSQLMDSSELVVIVHSLGTRDRTESDKVVAVESGADYLVPVFTKFQVLAVLKGKHTEKTLELCHYKYRPDAPGVGNGPELVWFPSREHDEISQNDEHGYWMQKVPTDFVLFLKKDERGQLTFVTGQFDAVCPSNT